MVWKDKHGVCDTSQRSDSKNINTYEYIRTISEGTYGDVHECVHQVTGHRVAIKRFKTAHLDLAVWRLAMREARVLQKLPRHPNIIGLRWAVCSEASRQLYFVFDHMERSLLQELRTSPGGTLPPPTLKLVAWQLLQALAHCHDNEVVHRDIKPANVLVSGGAYPRRGTQTGPDAATPDSEGATGGGSGLQIKLCDFGLARWLPSSGPGGVDTAASAAGPGHGHRSAPGVRQYDNDPLSPYVVTRWYRAPEVLVGDSYGLSADIWSYGCTLAELATGAPLFPGSSSLDQLWRITHCLGPLPPATRDRVRSDAKWAEVAAGEERGTTLAQRIQTPDRQLLDLIAACLTLDPRVRPTARELLQMPYFRDHSIVGAQVYPEPNSPSGTARRPPDGGAMTHGSWLSDPRRQAGDGMAVGNSITPPTDFGEAEDLTCVLSDDDARCENRFLKRSWTTLPPSSGGAGDQYRHVPVPPFRGPQPSGVDPAGLPTAADSPAYRDWGVTAATAHGVGRSASNRIAPASFSLRSGTAERPPSTPDTAAEAGGGTWGGGDRAPTVQQQQQQRQTQTLRQTQAHLQLDAPRAAAKPQQGEPHPTPRPEGQQLPWLQPPPPQPQPPCSPRLHEPCGPARRLRTISSLSPGMLVLPEWASAGLDDQARGPSNGDGAFPSASSGPGPGGVSYRRVAEGLAAAGADYDAQFVRANHNPTDPAGLRERCELALGARMSLPVLGSEKHDLKPTPLAAGNADLRASARSRWPGGLENCNLDLQSTIDAVTDAVLYGVSRSPAKPPSRSGGLSRSSTQIPLAQPLLPALPSTCEASAPALRNAGGGGSAAASSSSSSSRVRGGGGGGGGGEDAATVPRSGSFMHTSSPPLGPRAIPRFASRIVQRGDGCDGAAAATSTAQAQGPASAGRVGQRLSLRRQGTAGDAAPGWDDALSPFPPSSPGGPRPLRVEPLEMPCAAPAEAAMVTRMLSRSALNTFALQTSPPDSPGASPAPLGPSVLYSTANESIADQDFGTDVLMLLSISEYQPAGYGSRFRSGAQSSQRSDGGRGGLNGAYGGGGSDGGRAGNFFSRSELGPVTAFVQNKFGHARTTPSVPGTARVEMPVSSPVRAARDGL